MLGNLQDFIQETKRVLPVFLLLDISGSMGGSKIDSMNKAVRDMLNDFSKEALSDVDLQVCIITFESNAKVHTPLTNVHSIKYSDLVTGGLTSMGAALELCNQLIEDKSVIKSKWLRPTIVLVSDGEPTDNYSTKLKAFLAGKGGRCDKMAMGIGKFELNTLEGFLNDSTKKVFEAKDASDISKFFQIVTNSTVTKSKAIK